MNEKIKQLADEAGLRFTQLMSNPMVPIVDGKETDLEKFAELIVRECAGLCSDPVVVLQHWELTPNPNNAIITYYLTSGVFNEPKI